jgi:hypothetical protein
MQSPFWRLRTPGIVLNGHSLGADQAFPFDGNFGGFTAGPTKASKTWKIRWLKRLI